MKDDKQRGRFDMQSPTDRKKVAPADDQRATAVSPANDVARFLAELRSLPAKAATGAPARLMFAMDATFSRQPTWDVAQAQQSEMFREVGRLGGLDVQLVYFRGFNECRASRWVSDTTELARLMSRVDCRGGRTQIHRVLSHALAEAERGRVSALVYVGDSMEEDADELCHSAGRLALFGVPAFIFQEGDDSAATATFAEIARLTRGAHCRFDHGSGERLRDLLAAVAVYAAGGIQALADMSRSRRGATLLLEQIKR